MIWRWLHRHAWLTDLALTALLLAGGVAAVLHSSSGSTAAIVLTVAGTVPLVVRRSRPALVVAVVGVAALALVGIDAWIEPLPLAVAVYTLTSVRDTREARGLAGLAIVAIGVAVLVDGGIEFGAAAARVVLLVAAAVLGDSIRSRRAYVREIEEKAARLERERETQAQRAAAEEQARIARELHDVIAHALSVIVVQAGAADDAFEFDPARARGPIREVDRAARAALADLRRVLGIVQGPGGYQPQPSLGQLDRLVDSVRATGLDVTLEIDGRQQPLPAAVDLSAYRIVQEALTNSLKHAAAQHVQVRVRYGADLELEVRDDGRGAVAADGGGSGIVGMRERVALLGGRLDVGPANGGGYRVTAAIPLEPAR
jgi:signal transduction histidine kinase